MKKIITNLICLPLFLIPGYAQSNDPSEKHYQKWFNEFLFEPTEAKFVAVHYSTPTCWGHSQPSLLYGWKKNNDSLIYLVDKELYLYPSECNYINDTSFKDLVKSTYLKPEVEMETFERMHGFATGELIIPPVVIAAWCNAQGEVELGKEVMKVWKSHHPKTDPDSIVDAWKPDLQWNAYAGMVHHYMIRKDKIAERHSLRIQKLYRKNQLDEDMGQEKALIEELQRRKQNGNFNRSADSIPTGFESWDYNKRASFLIEQLDEVDARQWGQPGGVSLDEDWRVKALINMGEGVVPMLIDVIEKDKRFTRSVHFWRDFSNSRTVLNVKEAALTVIMSIWDDPLFEPVSTGDNFTSRGEQEAIKLAQQLREQLKKYQGKSLEERKLDILNNPNETIDNRLIAADDLANFGRDKTYGTMVWTNGVGQKDTLPNKLIDQWKNPTLAEMIWNAYEQDIKREPEEANYITSNYLFALLDLNDKRILPKITNLYSQSNDIDIKRYSAYVAYGLGSYSTWIDYCQLIIKGTLPLGPIEYSKGVGPQYGNPGYQDGNRELNGILRYFSYLDDTMSKKTLRIITSPGHPFYPVIVTRLIQLTGGYDDAYGEDDTYWNNTWCLEILKKELEDSSLSDIQMRGPGLVTVTDWGGQSEFRMHDMWDYSDFAKGEDYTEIRARKCDMAASKLYHLIFGIPITHVHLKDNRDRIERQKEFMKRFTVFRRITGPEYGEISTLYLGKRYVADVPRLDHPATEEEVNTGKAIFSMPGNKIAPEIQLPAYAKLKKDKGKEAKKVLMYMLVQAEYNVDGELIYGAFTEDGPKIIKAKDLVEITPYTLDKQ